jgi:hypothetical protein
MAEMQLKRPLFPLALLLVLAAASAAHADHDPLHRTVDGYSVYVGVVSAGVMAFREDHGELRMHGGVPAGLDQHHVLVNLFEAGSGARVGDADITARVSGARQPEEKGLLHVPLGSETGYGNFFRMRQGERYRIELTIRRAGATLPVTAIVDYRHRF